jgi:formylglycine-generating enzyme required for sulfatase activity
MVRVPAPDGTTYCIDSTEVTNKQYAAFLSAKGLDMTGLAPECSWNTTYTPSGGWPATGKDDYPVVYVDWCDAFAFCKWAGKRLCGKIGGGASTYTDHGDATKSQWFNACSKGGTLVYPYGNTYQWNACNGFDNGAGATVPAGSKATCEGGYAGLFDLSGNVLEWEDACDGTTSTDPCRRSGGSINNHYEALLTCGYFFGGNTRSTRSDTIGFRCCAE